MELKSAFKGTEVGSIPVDWEVRILGTICKLINGRGFKPHEWQRDGLPIIRIQNLNGSDDFNFYSGHYDRKLEIPTGQLLFAWSGSRGTSFGPHIWTGPLGLLNYHTWKVQTNESNVTIDFLRHKLRHLTASIEGSAHGASALVHVQKWQMEALKLAVPPTKAEQQSIAEALSDADALIDSLKQLLVKKKQVKQGAMQELLTGKRRLPGFSGDWVIRPIGDLLTIMHGKSQHAVEDRSGPYPILATGGQIGTAKSYLYDKPSVLIGRKGTIDQPRYMDKPFWTVDTLFYSKIKEPNIAKFIYYRFCLIDWKTHNEASGVPSLNARTIEKIEISSPPFDEQGAVAALLSNMDEEIEALKAKITKARAIKQGLMQELLTGRIRLI